MITATASATAGIPGRIRSRNRQLSLDPPVKVE
jgi:hypothetical protein